MIKLHGGPAAGTYMVKRAPVFLRAVTTPSGENDVLNMPEDEPDDKEHVSVYRREGESQTVHLNLSGKGSGFYESAEYHHIPDADGEQLRETTAWRVWCERKFNGRH